MRESGTDIVLGNTYHLMLRPGAERIARLGGLQVFTGWGGPMLTDSGGFQVMSLAQLRKIDERGVTFRSHIDGAKIELSPERAVEVQALLGSDIAMQLDECVRLPAERADIDRAMQLSAAVSLRWAERCRQAFEGSSEGRMLFGIVQGGDAPDPAGRVSAVRWWRSDFMVTPSAGSPSGSRNRSCLICWRRRRPNSRTIAPRYLMGVGTPDDILHSRGARDRHVRLRHADP